MNAAWPSFNQYPREQKDKMKENVSKEPGQAELLNSVSLTCVRKIKSLYFCLCVTTAQPEY